MIEYLTEYLMNPFLLNLLAKEGGSPFLEQWVVQVLIPAFMVASFGVGARRICAMIDDEIEKHT